jgi:biotin carboxyl carrier protein
MEHVIEAVTAGIVRELRAAPGDPLLEGQPLL